MNLLFDIGNTRLKWAYYSDDGIHSSASLMAVDVDFLELKKVFNNLPQPDSIWVSNVGSEHILRLVVDSCCAVFELEPHVIKVSATCCGIDNNYQTQNTLGVDRWIAAIGARVVVAQGHVIVIDAGTAVTIDWLSTQNNFEGGVILPGFSLMHAALVHNTAGIQSEYFGTQKVIGRTTEECVNSGVAYGLIGAIERIVNEMQQSIGEPTTVILTGGSAATIEAMANLDMIVQHDLVLLGVAKASLEIK